jgi:glycosyltransferase involved in cell wall biosynthesis
MALRISQHVSQKDFDIVQVEHLRGSRYGVFLKSRITTVPVIWDSVDCISHLFEQAATHSRTPFGKLVTRFELPRTQQAERDLVSKFDHVLVTSPVDRDALLGLTPAAKGQPHVSVLPNGVDLDYFHPNGGVQRDPAAIVFSGKMSYHANVTMAQYLATEIMPRVWRNRPAAHLYIVGKSPSSAVRALGKNPQITVTGTVDDIRPFLWRAAVSVAPLLYGAGIQNKILEAMASGTPVVSSCKALGALRVHPGRELLASDDTNGLADAILQVLEKPDLQSRLREAGMAYVRSFHNWSQIASDLADVYQQVLPSKKSPC